MMLTGRYSSGCPKGLINKDTLRSWFLDRQSNNDYLFSFVRGFYTHFYAQGIYNNYPYLNFTIMTSLDFRH